MLGGDVNQLNVGPQPGNLKVFNLDITAKYYCKCHCNVAFFQTAARSLITIF